MSAGGRADQRRRRPTTGPPGSRCPRSATGPSRRPSATRRLDMSQAPSRRVARVALVAVPARRFKVDVSVVVPTRRHRPAARRLRLGHRLLAAQRGPASTSTSGRITLLGLDGQSPRRIVSGSIEGADARRRGRARDGVRRDRGRRLDRRQGHAPRTISGSITCDLDNPPAGTEVHLDTVSGEITARVREDSDLRVSLNADLRARGQRLPRARPEVGRQHRDRRGSLGAGHGRRGRSAARDAPAHDLAVGAAAPSRTCSTRLPTRMSA